MTESAKGRPFTGVVLAGGRSTGLGRDKATLTLPDGRTLLFHAVRTLVRAGAHEVIVSVREGQTYRMAGTREVADLAADLGPLAGIAAALEVAAHPLVAVLAVDLSAMTPEYLRGLVGTARDGCGAVPGRDGQLEPLAAVYPRAAGREARAALVEGQLSVQQWARGLSVAGRIRIVPIAAAEVPLFANWSRPLDALPGPPGP